jgi:hypothetical protein
MLVLFIAFPVLGIHLVTEVLCGNSDCTYGGEIGYSIVYQPVERLPLREFLTRLAPFVVITSVTPVLIAFL